MPGRLLIQVGRYRLILINVLDWRESTDRERLIGLVFRLVMIEINALLGRHHNIVPRASGRDTTGFAPPAHDDRASSEAAFENFIPADERSAVAGEKLIHLPDEPALEFFLVFESQVHHAGL